MEERSNNLTFVDLFCGIGSFHHSLSSLGWKCVFACDVDKDCRNTYEKNYGLKPVGDIVNVDVADVPPFDVLCAGFPCQPFSIAGHQQGFNDSRGNMFFETMRFVEHHKPPCVILENIVGLEKHDQGKTLKKMIAALEEQSYNVATRVLTCSDYGIPQMRKRLFIVAMKGIKPLSLLNFPVTPSPTLTRYLNDGRRVSDHLTFTRKDVAYTIRCGGKHSPIDDGHNWDGYYVTTSLTPKELVYRLTIKDCLKLQGFNEDTFILIGSEKSKWKMVGNTIPTNFTRLIGIAIQDTLRALSTTTDKRIIVEDEANQEQTKKYTRVLCD
jgi:DNA (cytosine-5)-methyltransferase 1